MLALTYKNYRAEVDYDWLNLRWVGSIVSTDDLANVQGATIDEAERDFHKVIDTYLVGTNERQPEFEEVA